MTKPIKLFSVDGTRDHDLLSALKLCFKRKMNNTKTVTHWHVDSMKGIGLYYFDSSTPDSEIKIPDQFIDVMVSLNEFPVALDLETISKIVDSWVSSQTMLDWINRDHYDVDDNGHYYVDEDEYDGWRVYTDESMTEGQVCWVIPDIVMIGK